MHMIVPFMAMIMPAGVVVLRGEDVGGFLYRGFGADGAQMVAAAVQAFHVAQSGKARSHVARERPFDTDFFAAVGAVG